jgi:ABC-type glycerol-3-phosphate transport system substrate-binding protein
MKRSLIFILVASITLTLTVSCGVRGDVESSAAPTASASVTGNTTKPTTIPVADDMPEPAVTPEPVTIKLAQISVNPYIMQAIGEFNRKNYEAVRIELVDYTQYNVPVTDAEGCLRKLEQDIAAGSAPDILSLGQIPAEKYAIAGLLTDMTELLDNDPLIDRGDLFENVLKAGTYDGKLYRIFPVFSVLSLIGKTSVFGGGDITMAEINEIAYRYPDAEVIANMSAGEWIELYTRSLMSELVDWETGACDFDNAEFISMLESAKRFPENVSKGLPESDTSEYYESVKEKFREDKALIVYTYVSTPRIARNMRETFGEDVTFLGTPSANGANAISYAYYGDYGIMESSEHKEAAWEFISFLIRENSAMLSSMGITSGASIVKSDYTATVAAETIPFADRDLSDGSWIQYAAGPLWQNVKVDSPDQVNESEYANYHLTEDEANQAVRLIENATIMRSTYYKPITDIILEEAQPFLDGALPASEAAKAIQSRVENYLAIAHN